MKDSYDTICYEFISYKITQFKLIIENAMVTGPLTISLFPIDTGNTFTDTYFSRIVYDMI